MRNNTIAITTTLKCPVEQTISYVHYHLNIGIDHIFLYFDDPNDEATEILKNYKKISVTICNNEYWESTVKDVFPEYDKSILIYRQQINAYHSLQKAREMGIGWITHIDSDELIYAHMTSFKRFLKQSPFKVIQYTIMEAVPDRYSYHDIFKEVTLFKFPASSKYPTYLRYPIYSLRLRWAKFRGYKPSQNLNDDYFRSHTKSKTCVRTSCRITKMKIHKPAFQKRYLVFRSSKIRLLHFDGCGYEHWLNRWKFKLGGLAQKMPNNSFRVMMEQLIESDLNDLKLKKVYREMNYLNDADKKILYRHRLIADISLDHKIFQR